MQAHTLLCHKAPIDQIGEKMKYFPLIVDLHFIMAQRIVKMTKTSFKTVKGR